MKNSLFASLTGCIGFATALLLPKDVSLSKRSPSLQPRNTSCANTATSRGCWGDYSIDTNYYENFPDTGVTREYWLHAQNTTLAPDGVERLTLNFNGSIPGPLISADWGDTIIVHVTNGMTLNGTAIHWHGLRQLNNNEYDGVPGVTQCPIAPGETMTYKFRATEYGSSWYHSHYTLQYGDGLFGPIIINGPATADYDEDLGMLTLSDWGHQDVFSLWDAVQATAAPAVLENGLINGTNTYGDGGSRYQTVFKPGKKYRIRIVNAAVEAHFRFSIDNHSLKVIANDFVPLVPYETDNIVISMGQRYDMIVEAKTNRTTDNYWLRATWQSSCNLNQNPNNILGIVRYNPSSTANPTTTINGNWTDNCGDEPYESLVPHLSLNAGQNGNYSTLDLGAQFPPLLKWTINNSSLYLNWSDPTNLIIANGGSVFPTPYNVYAIPKPNAWVYWVLNDLSNAPPAHPIHLHGHDAFVLAQGQGNYSPSTTVLKFDNPPRRDTATLPSGGFLVLGFKTDNPGSWLMHCHIAWHASEGLALQFVERENEIEVEPAVKELLDGTCETWDKYSSANVIYQQVDSGI